MYSRSSSVRRKPSSSAFNISSSSSSTTSIFNGVPTVEPLPGCSPSKDHCKPTLDSSSFSPAPSVPSTPPQESPTLALSSFSPGRGQDIPTLDLPSSSMSSQLGVTHQFRATLLPSSTPPNQPAVFCPAPSFSPIIPYVPEGLDNAGRRAATVPGPATRCLVRIMRENAAAVEDTISRLISALGYSSRKNVASSSVFLSQLACFAQRGETSTSMVLMFCGMCFAYTRVGIGEDSAST
mmetsp:Transcript_3512/g.7570  ORF Transcript_3512/g.7570 Transcript_3512/m.7570 type:complete len:237 (-) Transcript_3512:256-966(-)